MGSLKSLAACALLFNFIGIANAKPTKAEKASATTEFREMVQSQGLQSFHGKQLMRAARETAFTSTVAAMLALGATVPFTKGFAVPATLTTLFTAANGWIGYKDSLKEARTAT